MDPLFCAANYFLTLCSPSLLRGRARKLLPSGLLRVAAAVPLLP